MLTGRAAPFAEVTPRLTGTDFSGRMMSPNVILSRFAGDAWDPPLKRRVFVCLSLATPFRTSAVDSAAMASSSGSAP